MAELARVSICSIERVAADAQRARAICSRDCHPSLQVTKREALSGLIQLRKELKNVPNISISNWQALSKERLTKLLGCLGEWPELTAVLTDNENIWNDVRVEAFDDNPNAANELQSAAQNILTQLVSLLDTKELAASLGIELPLNSDASVMDVLALVATVLKKPACHPQLIGNSEVSLSELDHLKSQWTRREKLVAARHPVILSEKFSEEAEKAALAAAERAATALLAVEGVENWGELSERETYHTERCNEIEASQKSYRRLCEQVGLVYSPLVTVRRADCRLFCRWPLLEQQFPVAGGKQTPRRF